VFKALYMTVGRKGGIRLVAHDTAGIPAPYLEALAERDETAVLVIGDGREALQR